jgi:hypothetical protein
MRRWRSGNRERERARNRARYAELAADPEWRREQAAKERKMRRARPKAALVLAAREAPCADCGVQHPPEVMDLDHVRGGKMFTLAQYVVARSDITLEQVEAEIAKCEVRCPTCHRLRHFNERAWRSGQLI